MKSNADLLNLYKEEKALVIGSFEERTGLEDFPTFKEWKLEYMKEYAETHDMDNPLSMEEAVAALEDEIEADNDELLDEADIAALAADPETPHEEETMTEETTPAAEAVEATPATTEEVTTKAPAKPKAAKKTAAKRAPAKKVAAKKRPPSKAAAGQKIFDRMYPQVLAKKKTRKDVIDELVAKAELTPNGAATYYQKMKKAHG